MARIKPVQTRAGKSGQERARTGKNGQERARTGKNKQDSSTGRWLDGGVGKVGGVFMSSLTTYKIACH